MRSSRTRKRAPRFGTVRSVSASKSSSRMAAEPDAPRPVAPAELGFERIVYTKEPPRATIRLNRPEVLNAFDFRMLRELARACEDASWDDEIRVVVVTGTGRAFCVGADLKSWGEQLIGNPGEYWKWFGAFKDMHDRLREIGKPTVARVQGIAVGGGKVDELDDKLAAKLPQTVRYTKQQLNWWRDISWHETVGHARDWLALSMLGDEARDAITAFLDSKSG